MNLAALPAKLIRRIRAWAGAGKAPLSQEEKWDIIDSVRKNHRVSILVESGTFLGDTVEHFKDKFEQVYSIELQPDLHSAAQQRFSADKNITLICGDSGQMMKDVLGELSVPAVFWLDGHYSSEFWLDGKFIKTARGTKDTPIEEELKKVLAAQIPHLILIDDARLFGIDKDYPSLGRIRKMVRRFKPASEVRLMGDIIAILPGPN